MGLEVSFYAWKKSKDEEVKPASQESIVRDLRPEAILLLVEPGAVSNSGIRPLISACVRSTCEALADALGLDGTGGVPDPDEPGDWGPSPVDPTKIDWERLAKIERLGWHDGVTVEVIKNLVAQGYSFEFSPSY